MWKDVVNVTKHDAMKAYIQEKVDELSGQYLNFNCTPDSSEGITFITNYSSKVIKKYIRSGAEKEYGFTILITKYFSTSTDELNLGAMNFAQEFMDWIDEQNRIGNYPDFGEKCQIKKIESLQNMPNFCGVDWENMTAQYMLQCRIIYFEKEN